MPKKTVKNGFRLDNLERLPLHLDAKKKSGRVAEVLVRKIKSGEKAKVRLAESQEGCCIEVIYQTGNGGEKDPGLTPNAEAQIRDLMGSVVSQIEKAEVSHAELNLDIPAELIDAAVLGLELALYRYKRVIKGDEVQFSLRLSHKGKELKRSRLEPGLALGFSVNLARHLTNLPPNILHPESYADLVKELFSGIRSARVDVWDEKKLAQEKMHLHLAVGQASAHRPRLVHIQVGTPGKKGSVALVGKGITFDSGGLDIKPSSGMRLMKKDMGGSAAVVAVAYWAARTKAPVALNAYLALAENSISSSAFRPSDVIEARNGLMVEIHNTDAEGRLVLADAMDVAVTAKVKPRVLIDVATLTGAIKVGLGAQLAGLFSNDNKLRSEIHKASQEAGDLAWPMPLYQKYRSSFNSNFADMINSPDGFGGAVTAALFLEKFSGDVPWAHLDIYAWKDSADGAWLESGGSGQSVMCLAEWLTRSGKR